MVRAPGERVVATGTERQSAVGATMGRTAAAASASVALVTGGYWYLDRWHIAPVAGVLALAAPLLILSPWRPARIFAAWFALTLGSIGVLISVKYPQLPVLVATAALAALSTWLLTGRDVMATSDVRFRYGLVILVLSIVTALVLRGIWNVMGSEGGCDLRIECYFP